MMSGVGGGPLEQAPREGLRVAEERRKRRHDRQGLPVPIVEHDGVACGGVRGDDLEARRYRAEIGAGSEESRQWSAADLAVHDVSEQVAKLLCNNEELVRGV